MKSKTTRIRTNNSRNISPRRFNGKSTPKWKPIRAILPNLEIAAALFGNHIHPTAIPVDKIKHSRIIVIIGKHIPPRTSGNGEPPNRSIRNHRNDHMRRRRCHNDNHHQRQMQRQNPPNNHCQRQMQRQNPPNTVIEPLSINMDCMCRPIILPSPNSL